MWKEAVVLLGVKYMERLGKTMKKLSLGGESADILLEDSSGLEDLTFKNRASYI